MGIDGFVCRREQIMSYALPAEIRKLIAENLATGIYTSEEDVLTAALHALRDYHATIADIHQGMIDYEQGRGQPLSEAMEDIRRELGAKL
jgi:Arc/MetJ-type ribon-helix-helix transcriptional regulator